MSSFTNIKKLMKAEKFSSANGGSAISSFLKRHPDVARQVDEIMLRFPFFEKSSEVLAWLSRGVKITKCLSCGKRLTYRNTVKGRISCSKSCGKMKVCREHKNQARLNSPEIQREATETSELPISENLNTFSKLKRTLINEKINPKGSSYFITEFFKKHQDFAQAVENFMDRVKCFANKSQVVEWLLLGTQIRKCVICGSRINYKLSKKGTAYFCSNACRRSPKGHEIWQENLKKSVNEKYGVDNVSQLTSTREKVRATNLERFGVENVSQSNVVKEKIKNTNLERYGETNPAKSEKVKEKIRQTFIDFYGVTYPAKNPEIAKKISKTALANSYENLKQELSECNLKFAKEIDFQGWIGLEANLTCLTCGKTFHYKFNRGKVLARACPHCYPFTQSLPEEEITNFIKKFMPNEPVLNNVRSLIYPKELDIYIPSKKLAIEFNGLYWHSESQGKDKRYHLDKTLACNEQGVRLVHIFEDEWRDKQQIVKNRLKHLLGLTPHKIFARKCEVRNVPNALATKFLNKYHIQGAVNASVNLGLFYKNRLVALMTFSKPRFNKNYDYELLRYCTIGNFTIIGGADKLFAYFKRNYDFSKIVSYADRRWSDGNLYRKLNFVEESTSAPAYYYTTGEERFNRVKFQKHKLANILEVFDPALSEFENMLANGYGRVWDCGNFVFVFTK